MALTGIEIRLNRDEYSRYEDTRSVVRARVIPTPATGLVSESVVVSLEKKGVPIATTTVVFDGSSPKGSVVEFDLREILDTEGVPHVNRGKYRVTATQASLTATATFSVAIITADAMRKSYCQGLHLVAGYKLMPKRQPTVVTGLTVTSVSKDTKKGVYALEYDSTAKTVKWAGGVAITLTDDSTSEILLDTRGNYIEVDVDYYSLPTTNSAEALLLDQEELPDTFLQDEIERATQEVESMLKIMLEPTRIATEPYYSTPAQGEYFDAKATSLSFYEKDFNLRGMGWHLSLPYHQVGKVTDLAGYIGNTRALTISPAVTTVNRKAGILDVLPYNSQYAMYWIFFMGMNFWGTREFIADFWRYKAIVGLDEGLPAEIIKMVGYTAAISILTTAEQAWRAGMTSESVSKDGVSRSQSYNAKGVYDTAVQEYKDWIKTNTPRFRNLYRGIPCVVL